MQWILLISPWACLLTLIIWDAVRARPIRAREKEYFEQQLADWTAILSVSTIVLVAMTALSAAILWRTDETLNRTLVAQDRAWIEPTAVALLEDLAPDKKPRIELSYMNVGKSPARFEINSELTEVETILNSVGDLVVAPVSNDRCEAFGSVHSDANLLFPDGYIRKISLTFPRSPDADLFSGKTSLILRGCIRYETHEVQHVTAFCYVVKEREFKTSIEESRPCFFGNYAN